MCGRYTIVRPDRIKAALEATPIFEEFDEKRVVPRFNIAPSQQIPLVRIDHKGNRVIDLAKWGLIPAWSKTLPKLQPINARAESVPTSGMFRQAFQRRRCLIPADGFYEWQATGPKQPKQPYFIHFKDDRTFAFAGLWEKWKPEPGSGPIETCTIITTNPNTLMEKIHNRMPVIVDPKDYNRWLDPNIPGSEVVDILKPFQPDEMEAYPITTAVNSPKHDGPELLEPPAHDATFWTESPPKKLVE
jgi:putative SOS response-associated peptidase YedK